MRDQDKGDYKKLDYFFFLAGTFWLQGSHLSQLFVNAVIFLQQSQFWRLEKQKVITMETDPFFQCVASGREKVFITFLEVGKMSKACFLALDLTFLPNWSSVW